MLAHTSCSAQDSNERGVKLERTDLSVVTGVHPEVERFNVPGSPLEPRHLLEPAHHVPPELRLVLVGRHPVVAPGGGHILPHGVPVCNDFVLMLDCDI